MIASLRRVTLTAVLLLTLPAAAQGEPLPPEPAPVFGKVALLVGISHYSPSGGWSDLHTEADLERMRAALEAQGFEADNIHTLTDAEANREGIETAFRRYLIDGASRGAVAFFHYSGHGQRITDNNHDEIDGYDESLVPFDAPQRLLDDYDGGRHLRDDDLHDWLQQLRRKIGPEGDVVISLDSCFSGAATRGLTARGSLEPLGSPQAQLEDTAVRGRDRAGGFVEVGATDEGELAPFIVFSSARHDELAFETQDEQGRQIGSLSFALGTALRNAGEETTYTGLYDQVKRIMAGQVRNRPQLEGRPNRRILGGEAVSQKPFYEIARYDADVRTAHVRGGALAGLLEGSKVAVLPAGTRDSGSDTTLATGTVASSRSFTAEVVFDKVTDGVEIEQGWLFITEPSFGNVRIRAYIGDGAWRTALVEHLATRKLIEQVAGRAESDVVIEDDGRGVEVYKTVDGTPLLAPLSPDNGRLVLNVRQTLEDYARNRWLRRVEATSRDIRVDFELRPCRVETTENYLGDTIETCGADLARITEGGELDLQVGDGFELKLFNSGRKDAYVVVLDLMPDGRIDLLYPHREEMGEDNKLKRGKSFTISGSIGEPLGNEVFKLFATGSPVDFRPILSGNFNPGATRSLLDKLLAGAFDGTRATPTVSSGAVSTDSLAFTISAAGER